MTSLVGLFDQLGGNLFDRVLRTHRLIVPVNRLHGDEIDDAKKFGFGTDLNIDRNSARTQTINDGRGRIDSIRTGLVHLIDEANAGNLVLVSLTPDSLRLRLNAGDRIEAGNRTVEDTKRSLNLSGEVHVAWGVDDIDADVLPGAGCCG